MKTTNAKRLTYVLANVAAALLETALAMLGVIAWRAQAGMMSALLLAGTLAALAATLVTHVQLVARHLARPRAEDARDSNEPTATTRAVQEARSAERVERVTPVVAENAPRQAIAIGPARPTADRLAPAHATEPRSRLDLDALCDTLLASGDPLAELRLFVNDVRERETADEGPRPSPFERFAARVLDEAGLFANDVELPELRVVRPATTQMFYLRIATRRLPYLATVRVLALEAALNAVCLSSAYFDDPDAHEVEEHYQLAQSLARSVCAQSPNLRDHVPVIDDDEPDTEWAVRMGISTAIETLRLPYRLTANWRVNVADGNVAIELDLTPEAVFPASCYVDGLGLVASSREMRRKASSAYALRLALLVAACAFRCSERIRHVWVAGVMQTATRRDCYLSVDFDRWRFSRLDLADLGPLEEAYHVFVPQLRYDDAILRPVRQTFSLDEPRFCPPRRYENVGLSNRRLDTGAARALGTDHVSGLAINESDKRELIATDIMRSLTSSTEVNVRAIMELAGDDPDPSVRSAAERTIGKLIDGTLSDEPLDVGEEFISGDVLSRAVVDAQQAFLAHDLRGAARVLATALSPLDDVGAYADSATVEWRYFPSYVNRAMYNRLCATEGRTLMLVPDAYFEAHLLLSAVLLAQGRGEQALEHARRLVELSPLDARARLHATRCLEALDRMDEAVDMLSDLLVTAHDPHSIGLGYYRMAFFQWQRGNYVAAQACYQRSLAFMPGSMPLIAMEMSALALQSPGTMRETLSPREAEESLRAVGVPVAPTETVSETFLSAARASLDAEVFPVARGFVNILGAFAGDDIVLGLIRSIEEEPDF